MASCSKAPWGLFVLLRVDGIFTVTAISPSPSLRQCPDRDAFRAGRNLPDKEFRYLRTVIVTAAVHRGFGSELNTPPLNLPALGRHQPLYVVLRLQQGPVVLLSSRLGLFGVTVDRSSCKSLHRPQSRFFRRYARNLPSSLTRDHSSTLACSASLPVSVCGTGSCCLPRAPFSPAQVPRPCGGCRHPRSHSPLGQCRRGFASPGSLPAWTTLVSSRRFPLRIAHRSNDSNLVPDCLPVVHRVRLAPTP